MMIQGARLPIASGRALSRGMSFHMLSRRCMTTTTTRGSTTGLDGRVCTVLGAQWGDEGKGKLADVLAEKYDLICRFNGGANAGHTVIANGQKFAFHLLPCGLIYPHTKNLLGNGVVVDMEALFEELGELDKGGIDWQGRLFLSDRAPLLFDFHKQLDGVMEGQRSSSGNKSIGTTKKGIGPAYSTKMLRNGLRVGHMRHRNEFLKLLRSLIESHKHFYQLDIEEQDVLDKYDAFASRAQDMIVDGVALVNESFQKGDRIIAEGANAAMLDIDFGTFPFVTSSNTTVGGVCTGLGLSPGKIDSVLGVAKAYTTRVGGGPFPTELTDSRGDGDRPDNAPETDIGYYMQMEGKEYGVTTGRKRRCGWLDAVVLKYGNLINGYSGINLTKLDVLDDLDYVKIGVAYTIDGVTLSPGAMPSTIEDLARVEVTYESKLMTFIGPDTQATSLRKLKWVIRSQRYRAGNNLQQAAKHMMNFQKTRETISNGSKKLSDVGFHGLV